MQFHSCDVVRLIRDTARAAHRLARSVVAALTPLPIVPDFCLFVHGNAQNLDSRPRARVLHIVNTTIMAHLLRQRRRHGGRMPAVGQVEVRPLRVNATNAVAFELRVLLL